MDDAADPMHTLSQADMAHVIARALAERRSRAPHQRQVALSAALQVAGEAVAESLQRAGYVMLHPLDLVPPSAARCADTANPPHPAD